MLQCFLRSSKTVTTVPRSLTSLINPSFLLFYSSSPNPPPNQRQPSPSPIASPTRVLKLISAQSDPLLAKEIFDIATTQPGFRHSYSSFLVLILKLGRSKHFSLVDDLLVRLKSDQYRVTPTLFSYLIKIYAEADLPEKALSVFYKMLEFNVKPLPRHLNRILELLVSHRNFIMPAFDLFKTAHKYEKEELWMLLRFLRICLQMGVCLIWFLIGLWLEGYVIKGCLMRLKSIWRKCCQKGFRHIFRFLML
ncbi:hypothetical protein E1A91_D12G135500v1 [Gossypium mustelinum]|uniref:Pentacotripeptide-repeat region of PRORP domain-containing protein n=1 Tax=Gossypium mustelinum TaxID=34275 RepID=A0A5D2SGA9_GOSMU|nr:hypothetical protein E1A91_D12G135500v1 [Gossypium mustelinum]TYI50884.1 hypothetical protein E1A91_D12G135500v1 [Gossypium mustelinum]